MNYIGSKYSLLGEIEAALDDSGVPSQGIAFDAFSGTGAVAQFLKYRGHIVYANDWQHYSYVTNRAFLLLDALPTFPELLDPGRVCVQTEMTEGSGKAPVFSIWSRRSQLKCGRFAEVISHLNRLSGKRGSFYEAYCEGGSGGRTYFSSENGLKIQAIRDCIEEWHIANWIDGLEHSWLVASLVESADRVANTASVYAAFLKHIKKSAQKPLKLLVPDPRPSSGLSGPHQVFQEDVLTALAEHSHEEHVITYIDPPYNHRQYASYYHILETISRWDLDAFTPRLKTGLREKMENLSPFCMKSRAYGAFDKLFSLIKSDYTLFSYNNEGVLSEGELESLFEAHFGCVNFKKINYQRFRADNDSESRNYKSDTTHEFLVLARDKKEAEGEAGITPT
jgi:adenine-specific DNA-methyltransferase